MGSTAGLGRSRCTQHPSACSRLLSLRSRALGPQMLSLRAETAEARAPGACAQQQERPMREARASLLGAAPVLHNLRKPMQIS